MKLNTKYKCTKCGASVTKGELKHTKTLLGWGQTYHSNTTGGAWYRTVTLKCWACGHGVNANAITRRDIFETLEDLG